MQQFQSEALHLYFAVDGNEMCAVSVSAEAVNVYGAALSPTCRWVETLLDLERTCGLLCSFPPGTPSAHATRSEPFTSSSLVRLLHWAHRQHCSVHQLSFLQEDAFPAVLVQQLVESSSEKRKRMFAAQKSRCLCFCEKPVVFRGIGIIIYFVFGHSNLGSNNIHRFLKRPRLSRHVVGYRRDSIVTVFMINFDV